MRTLQQLMDLSGRVALVTGGAGHIGTAMCEALVELGASVAVVDVDPARCAEAAGRLNVIRPAAAVPFPCDLSVESETRAVVRALTNRLGGLDIVVHAAAYVGTTSAPGWAVAFAEQTSAAFEAALRVNVTAAFVLAQEAREALSASGRGSMILLGSTYGTCAPDYGLYQGTSMANPVGYGVSKGGVRQLARYLSTTLAPRVRVNTISPGGVWRNQPAAFRRRYEERTPLGRMATEEDIKGAVAYLASDLSAYVTGHDLLVDGGWTAW